MSPKPRSAVILAGAALLPALMGMFLVGESAAAYAAADFSPAPYFAPEHYLSIDGAEICYLDQGAGQTMILVHGWAGNAWNWMSVFDRLALSRRVIALDLPGHGKSGIPEGFDHAMRSQAGLIVRLMDELGIETATLVGSSMGGSIVAWTAIDNPGRVDRLIIVDGAGTSVQNPLMKAAGFLIAPSTAIPLIHAFFPVNQETLAGVPESERKRVELAEELYQSPRHRDAGRALSASMRGLARESLDDRLAGIEAKTLVIWGSDDGLLPIAAGEKYRDLIPNARLVIIEGGNHTPMQWTPEKFIEVVEEFMGKN